MTHFPYDPLTTPHVAVDAEGIRYPVSEDLKPRLATRWDAADDFRTWTVHLRRGVISHAGNELTADDVKWSWDRTYALRALGVWRSRGLGGLDAGQDLEPIDRYTLRFQLSGPNPEFPQYLSFGTNNIVDSVESKRHSTADDPWATEWLGTHVAGYGPFNLAGQEDDTVRFEARPAFWGGRPGVDSITLIGVADREAGLRLLERGEANMALGLYPEELARFAGRAEYHIERVRANHSTLEFNWLSPPFDDQNVRQAVCFALPYERILDHVYRGFAQQSKSPIPSVTKYHTPVFWKYSTDLARARELMKDSTYPDGFQTELYIQPSYESLRFGEIVREALKPVGIEVDVRVLGPDSSGPVPMWFKEECGHALLEPMYDIGHDYAPPLGIHGGRTLRDKRWTDRIRAIRRAASADQPELYRQFQKDIVEFATCAHIAEIQTGWVFRNPVDPWVLSAECLGVNMTVWSGHRQILPWR
jgi:peptide/nickel transport system substrate-binding protein